VKTRQLLLYFVLAYAISWALWAPAFLAHFGLIGATPTRYLHLAGGLGPLIAGTTVTALVGGPGALARLARRCAAGGHWLVLAVLLPATLFLVASAFISATSTAPVEWSRVGASTELPELPAAAYWLANLLFYGYGEEVGWRGFALPRLQRHASALKAALLLAVGWAGWHLPLFVFSPGMSSLAVGGAIGWFASLCLGSILLTWIFNSSGGSIAAVAVFHAALDIFIMSPVSPSLPNIMGAIITLGALLLIPVFGAANLSDRQRIVEPPSSE
jgi:membrane protease YdiL (CAAX protease family)